MNLKAALLATATAGALLLVPACGGDAGPSQADNVTGDTKGSASSVTPAQYIAIDLNVGSYGSTTGRAIGDGEQAGGSCSGHTTCTSHALLWRGSASTIVDLQPDGFIASVAVATSGGVQVGAGQTTSGRTHALKWAGSAGSVVDLDPTGFWSTAQSIAGGQIVGSGQKTNVGPTHALLWINHLVVDLHPSGYSESFAMATDGAQQVGGGHPVSLGSGYSHALLWAGNAESVVDLHPLGGNFVSSNSAGVSGGQQVGVGIYTSDGQPVINGLSRAHALLWRGSSQSVVDLHPGGFSESGAAAVAADRQVGFGITADGLQHALVWNGTADSVVDLHVFLPPGFSRSFASGIDASGNVVGWAEVTGTEETHAILWVRQ